MPTCLTKYPKFYVIPLSDIFSNKAGLLAKRVRKIIAVDLSLMNSDCKDIMNSHIEEMKIEYAKHERGKVRVRKEKAATHAKNNDLFSP